jgi:hypothetical protein
VFRGKRAGEDILAYGRQGKWGWRRLHNEEPYEVHFSPDIRVIYSRRIGRAGHVTRMGDRRGALKFSWKDLRKGDHLEERNVYWRVILKWYFKK